MKILRRRVEIVPYAFLATQLNAPCSSLCLAQETPESALYLIAGKCNGEIIFFPTADRSQCISKYESEIKMPVTIAIGDLRNTLRTEVVLISNNGHLQSLSFPPTPNRVFSQILNANICSAEILDIDGDGLSELIAVMTDRVVRSYRFMEKTNKLAPLNKWEMPAQISGWSIGLGDLNFVLLSQLEESHYVRLGFATSDTNICIVQSSNPNKEEDPGSCSGSRFVFSQRPFSAHLLHYMASGISILDQENKETPLKIPRGDISCVSTTTLLPGIQTLVALNPWGDLFVYAWSESEEVQCVEPVAYCRILKEANHICIFPGPKELQLLIGIVNVYNKVVVISVELADVISV